MADVEVSLCALWRSHSTLVVFRFRFDFMTPLRKMHANPRRKPTPTADFSSFETETSYRNSKAPISSIWYVLGN